MRRFTHAVGWILALAMPGSTQATTPQELFDKMAQADLLAMEGIESMRVGTEIMGKGMLEYLVKTSVVTPDGQTRQYMRNVPPIEMHTHPSGESDLANAPPETLREMADELERLGAEAELEVQREIKDSGIPPLLGDMLMNPPEDEPWLSTNPRDIGGMYATMLRGAAEGKEDIARRDAEVVSGLQDQDRIALMTRLVGDEVIDGRRAYHLVAPDLNLTQVDEGVEFTLQNAHIWVDAERYVALRLKMEGELREGRERRDFVLERRDEDYRVVPGCGPAYRPFKTVMSMGGMMNAEQEAQMREAQAQMAQFEQQMQQMPAAQREMMMRQMGPQIEMMRNMSETGGIQMVMNVVDLQCNVPPPSPEEMAMAVFGAGAMGGGQLGVTNAATPPAPLSATGDSLTQRVQADLIKLGYEPGAATGEVTTETTIAIAKFEAERGLTVTGEVSPQLAGMLAAEVDKRAGAPTPQARDPEALRAAQQACLQQRAAAAQDAEKKKRGLGRLASAAGRLASRMGNQEIVQATSDAYIAGATAEDLSAAARDLGLNEDDVAACQNP